MVRGGASAQPHYSPLTLGSNGPAHRSIARSLPGSGPLHAGEFRSRFNGAVPATWLDELLQPGRRLHNVSGELLSDLDPNDRGTTYDRRAALYDRLVGNKHYNRLLWGASTASYAAFAGAAVADDARGPLLDVGCGSAVFTAAAYRNARRPLVLVDRSLGMLARAAHRLRAHPPEHLSLIQTDLFDLPFRPGQFTTVACHGLLHLFDDAGTVLRALRAQIAVGGSLYVTSLVAETSISRWALGQMHRVGEAAAPRREDDLATAIRATVGGPLYARCEGAMMFICVGPLTTPVQPDAGGS